jgi:cardiolipin synthase (CMP-forming)
MLEDRSLPDDDARSDNVVPGAARATLVSLPNLISCARLSTVPVFVWLFVNGREDAAVIVYGAGAFTDFLDGYIARKTHSVTELGKLLDPLADRIFIVALSVALVTRDTLPAWLAVGIIGRDVILLSLWPLLERRGIERIRVNLVGKTATALLFVGLTWLALSETSFALGRLGRPIGVVCAGLGAVLYWLAAGMYARRVVARARRR